MSAFRVFHFTLVDSTRGGFKIAGATQAHRIKLEGHSEFKKFSRQNEMNIDYFLPGRVQNN